MKPPPHPSVRAMLVVLRAGTIVSTALLALGLAAALAFPGAAAGQSMLAAGLLILMATPVAHLLVAVADEVRAREWGFVATGVVVLLLLGGSVMLAVY